MNNGQRQQMQRTRDHASRAHSFSSQRHAGVGAHVENEEQVAVVDQTERDADRGPKIRGGQAEGQWQRWMVFAFDHTCRE